MLTVAETKIEPAVIATALSAFPQTECPVVHHFSDGVYIREMSIPAGTFIVGHAHNEGGVNFLLQGAGVLFVDGLSRKVEAPQMIHAGAGVKMMYALSDVVWMNVFPNPDNERDIQILENRLVTKDETFLQWQAETLRIESDSKIQDVAHFSGVDESIIDALESLQVAPSDCSVEYLDSPIAGIGAFAPFGMDQGQIVGFYCDKSVKSELASRVNHSKNPNCELMHIESGVYLVVKRPVHGRLGGMHGEELTIDYRSLPSFIEVKS